jgi:hypothetical protein
MPMRRLLPVLFIVLSLIPAAAFAQTEADEGEPAPSIGLLGLIGFSPADFDPAYRRAVVDANRAYWNRLKADQPDPAERIAAILSDRLS